MPYQIRGYPKKSYKSQKNQSTRMIAKRALKKATTLQKNDELKWLDTSITDATVSSASAAFTLNSITQGTTESNMIGDHCRMTSIQYNVGWKTTNTQTETYQIRFLLVKFRDSTVGSTLTTVLLDSAGDQNVHSLYEMTGRDNYKILEDKVITVQASTAAGDNQRVHRVKRQLNAKFSSSELSHEQTIKLFVLHNYTDESINISGKSRVFFKEL